MPLIKAQAVIAQLKPELPTIKKLIESRNRKTGEVRLPLGLQTRLFAEQELRGVKGQRGSSIYFDQVVVEALLQELQQRRARQRSQQQARVLIEDSLLALAECVDAATARGIRRNVARQQQQAVQD